MRKEGVTGGERTTDLLAILTQPPTVLLIAIGVFLGQVVYLAKRLKSASRNLLLADTRALEEAQRALDAHHESLESAKGAIRENLGGARDALRDYKHTLKSSIDDRRRYIEWSMKGYDALREQKAFKDAKKLVHDALPRKTHRSPKTI